MTDFQFKKLLEMILTILKHSKDLPEAIEQVERLLKDEK